MGVEGNYAFAIGFVADVNLERFEAGYGVVFLIQDPVLVGGEGEKQRLDLIVATVSDLGDEVAVRDGDADGDERGRGGFAGVGAFAERGRIITRRVNKLKEEVIMMLDKMVDPVNKLELIDLLQKLGLSNHYKDDIKKLLKSIYDNISNNDKWDKEALFAVALKFRLLRQHGYNVSQVQLSAMCTSQRRQPHQSDIETEKMPPTTVPETIGRALKGADRCGQTGFSRCRLIVEQAYI
nr:myrcene synthase, chloroplastic [Quercus suber]